jgi:dUTP pyrophosphatase
MDNELIKKMKDRILDISNPDSDYTHEDFEKEFGESYLNTNFSFNEDKFKKLIRFVNKSNNPDPEYATEGSSGFDLRANLEESITIPSGKVKLVPTGLFFELPENMEIQVRPRSGLAVKNGISVLNTPGTVDSDYRGEIKVILINHGDEDFVINNGDRIAQAVVAVVTAKNFIKLTRVDKINTDTNRNSGGFGSTGKN